jgi:hypothetical protein
MRTPKNWKPVPNSENSAWTVGAYVVRKQHDAYFLRLNNGTSWGNGDLVHVCHTIKQVSERLRERGLLAC